MLSDIPVYPLSTPCVRPVEFIPVRSAKGESAIMVRDPLGVIEGQAVLSAHPILLVFLASAVYVARHDFVAPPKASQPLRETAEQPKIEAVATGEELTHRMAADLAGISESESARRAFNALAGLWKVPPLPESPAWDSSNGLEWAAADRKLRLYRFSGNLGSLSRINCPAALELTLPGLSGSRYVTLASLEQNRLTIDPPLGGRKSLLFHEIEAHWSGKGFLLWKDFFELQGSVKPGLAGEPVKQLQNLLREAGAYDGPSTGVYDGNTLAAVKALQLSKGLGQDGRAGSQTLISLYAAVDRFTMPRLGAGRK